MAIPSPVIGCQDPHVRDPTGLVPLSLEDYYVRVRKGCTSDDEPKR